MAPNPHNVSTIVLVVGIQKPFYPHDSKSEWYSLQSSSW